MTADHGVLFCPPLNGKEPVLLYSINTGSECYPEQLTAAEQQIAEQFVASWRQAGVSRYNRYRDDAVLPVHYVLLILQQGQSAGLVQRMLAKAQQLAADYAAKVLLCDDQHHDTTGIIASAAHAVSRDNNIDHCTPQQHHARLLANAHCVITANSWLGFEALLWQKPVYTFLPSFYQAMTIYLPSDHQAQSKTELAGQHTNALPWVWQVFFKQAVTVNYTAATPTEFASSIDAIVWLGWQRKQRQRFASELYAIGFNRIWRPVVRLFLQGSTLHFVSKAQQVPANAHAVSWGFKPLPGLASSVKLTRLEDGFLRSVGLGAQFVKPLSWVADTSGLYFDATTASDLESLLAQQQFSQDLLEQASAIIEQLTTTGISKYNTGQGGWQRPATSKKVILVPGQVETDASIARGAPGIKRNIDLLQAVRQANPDAWLVYKPHPDVLAGARSQGENEQDALRYCDQQVTDCSIAAMFSQIDEVHVLTSLAGFEALIRGVNVTCYGMPFYAGWGLTTDRHQSSRRGRKLTLEQLVAATLLLYPLYICRHSGYYNTAQGTLADLQRWRQETPTINSKLWQWLRWGLNKVVKPK